MSDLRREAAPMYYAELPAHPELRPWIAAHWHFRVARDAGEILHTVPLTGGVMLHVSSRAPETPILTGPRTVPLETPVRGGELFWGTHLWPGAAESLLDANLDVLREAIVPAETCLDPGWTHRLAARLAQLPDAGELDEEVARSAARALDEAWRELAAGAGPLDREVMGAVFRVIRSGGEERVAQLAEQAGLSPRHFRRRFRAAVGLAPKELARLRRVRASAAHLVAGDDPWVRLAAEHGYADQAHLVREYRALLGLTPTAFRDHALRIEHGPILS